MNATSAIGIRPMMQEREVDPIWPDHSGAAHDATEDAEGHRQLRQPRSHREVEDPAEHAEGGRESDQEQRGRTDLAR